MLLYRRHQRAHVLRAEQLAGEVDGPLTSDRLALELDDHVAERIDHRVLEALDELPVVGVGERAAARQILL